MLGDPLADYLHKGHESLQGVRCLKEEAEDNVKDDGVYKMMNKEKNKNMPKKIT